MVADTGKAAQPRHVIVGFDDSSSMKKRPMNQESLQRVRDYLLEILYDRLPAGFDAGDEVVTNTSDLKRGEPLLPSWRRSHIFHFFVRG